MKTTIWIVDDKADVFYDFIPAMARKGDYRLAYVNHVKHVHAKQGDIIFLDLIGTGANYWIPPEGTTVLSMTGSHQEADLHKPFSEKQLLSAIDMALGGMRKAAA